MLSIDQVVSLLLENSTRMVKVLAIDPGKSTGWAEIYIEDNVIKLGMFGVCKDTTLVELIPNIKEADHLVYEAWLTRPKHLQRGAFDWDPMITPQVIGSFLTLCKALEKPEPAKQQPSIACRLCVCGNEISTGETRYPLAGRNGSRSVLRREEAWSASCT